MKILQINCVYGKGSTGKITRDIHQGLLDAGHESVVIYGRGRASSQPGVYKLCPEWYAKLSNLRSRLSGVMYGGSYFSTNAILARIRREKPDIVHVQCVNGYFCSIFRLLEHLKASGVPTVMTLHAEFLYTGSCGHAGACDQWIDGCKKCPERKRHTKSLFLDRTGYSWKKMHGIYRDWKELTVVGCSDWITGRASRSGSLADRRVITLRNGVDNTSVFYPRPDAGEKLRERYGIPPSKKILLFIAPAFTHLKGFDLVLELARKSEGLPFHFLLAGEQRTVNQANVTVLGPIADQDALAELYSGADALIVCSRFENYPTVCLEAASCGTPIAGYAVGGVAETIPDGMGGVVPLGDVQAMKELLLRITDARPDTGTVRNARYSHSKERMVRDYMELYQSLLPDEKRSDYESQQ